MKATSAFSSPSSCDLRGGGAGKTASGCLSRILRRILCFSSLPLCSFDHFKVDDERERERESWEAIGAAGATPGVVARLMGLESIPRPREESPFLPSADQFKAPRSPPVRRPRGIPPYRELQDEKFFILSFERRRESHVGKLKSSRTSRRIHHSMEEKKSKREKSRRESVQGKNKENENPDNLPLLLNNPCKKSTTKMAKKNCLAAAITFENGGDSENSSPNSVLEFVGFSADQESASPGEISRLANSKMRRPLSDELESCGDSKGKLSNDDRLDLEGENLVKLRHKQPKYAAKLGEIGKFAAMETMRSSWLHDEILRNKQCLLEIGRDVASTIFDHLLEELVINLEQF